MTLHSPPVSPEAVAARELAMVSRMIALYCHGHHATGDIARGDSSHCCPRCERLLAYARLRLERCPHLKREGMKPSCRRCTIHCYAAEMREEMRRVMRWAGPRMLLYHPLFTIRHWFS